MKRNILIGALAATIAIGASAREASGLKVYINPGHGGHDADDRNVVIAPYAQGDPEGYWESNSNLSKGLQLRDMLEAKGYTVVMSRVTNTSDDDLGLSTIVRLSNESKADIFFSIHSNATGTTSRRNQPLMLFRGYDDQPVKANDKVICEILNKYLLQNQTTVWTGTNINVRGDFSFYPQWNGAGLGVLRGNTVTAMLSEGSFHDYVPEAYRLMNDDFCWLEAWHFRKAIDEYFGVDGLTTGAIAGRLNDSRLPRDGQYLKFGEDKLGVVLGAKVELIDADGKVVDTYTTETKHINGFYLFKDVAPGTYTVRAASDTHYGTESTVTVVADEVAYCNMRMNRVRSTPPVVEGYSPVWNEGDEGVLCNSPITFNFNWDMDTEATEKALTITPAVEGTFTWEELNCRMVFTPTTPYEINTKYTVTLGTDAMHASGMHLEEPFTFSFTTAASNYMSILGSFPKQDEPVHYKNATIEFRFDKKPNVQPILHQVTCTDSKGNAVSFNRRSMKSSTSKDAYGFFRIPFTNALTVGETYSLKVAQEFADKDGLTLREPVEIEFKAVDAAVVPEGASEVDSFNDATAYAYDADGSVSTASATVAAAAATDKLMTGATKFTYEFNADEESETRFGRSDHAAQIINPGQVVTVHLNGDLTGNAVYLELTSDVSTQYLHVADMDFLGWRYLEIPVTVAEAPSQLTAVKVVQQPSQMSHKGAFMLEGVNVKDAAGVDDITVAAGITVHPNPATEYLIANGGNVITQMALVSMSGTQVAQTAGNVLNVSETPAGSYLLVVKTAETQTVHKVIVKH